MLVSHDTHLVKMVADQLWVVAGGKVTPFDGDIDDYQAKLLRERNGGKNGKAGKAQASDARSEEAPAPAPPPRGSAAVGRHAAKRGRLKRRIETAEKEHRQAQQAARRARGQACRSRDLLRPAINVAELQREKVRLEREIAHAEHEWLVAQEAYEAA